MMKKRRVRSAGKFFGLLAGVLCGAVSSVARTAISVLLQQRRGVASCCTVEQRAVLCVLHNVVTPVSLALIVLIVSAVPVRGATSPALTSFLSSSADGVYGVGDTVQICAEFDRNLQAPSTMTVTLDTGAVVDLSGPTAGSVGGTMDVDASQFTNHAGFVQGHLKGALKLANGKYLIWGSATDIDGNSNADYIARINADGSLDTNFAQLNLNNSIFAVGLQSDGKIIIGGSFSTFNGVNNGYVRLARLNTDGTLDTTFAQHTINGTVEAITIQDDDKILIGGAFKDFDGVSTLDRIARLNPDGTRDTSFDPASFNNVTYAITVQDDGKILVGGAFHTYNGNASYDRLVRLNTDGSQDTAFSDNFPADTAGSITEINIQPDGRIVIAGSITDFDGQANLDNIARINPDGSRDATFTGTISSTVYAVYIEENGKILVSENDAPHLSRLNADGSLDASFTMPNALVGNKQIYAVFPDGDKLFIAGNFNDLGGDAAQDKFGHITGDSNTPGSAANQICGTYTVGAGENSTDLTIASIDAENVQDTNGNTQTGDTIPSGGNLADTSAIVINTTVTAPGGVDTGLALWLKADGDVYTTGTTQANDGQTIDTWKDSSGSGNDAGEDTAGGAGSKSVFTANGINFNPTVDMTSTDDRFALAQNAYAGGAQNATVYMVTHPSNGGAVFVQESNSGSGATPVFKATGHVVLSPATQINGQGNATGLPKIDAYTQTDTNSVTTYGNNAQINSATLSATPYTSLTGNNYIGARVASAPSNFQGLLSEIIVYNASHNATQRQQVSSYLALKYGITLDQSTATDYLASDGVTVAWDASAAGVYNNDIFGIGKDIGSALDQRISKSVDPDAIVTISTDNNFTNSNSAHSDTIPDGEFLTIANNDGTATWESAGAPSGFKVLNRKWQAQNTGNVTGTNIAFDVADPDFDVPTPIGSSDYYLVVDSNGNGFADDTPVLLTNSGGDLWSAAQDFADGDTFTLATTGYTISIAKTADGAESGTDASFTVTVTPANTTGSAITGDISYGGTATAGSDYATGPATFSIADGTDNAVITLTTTDDTIVEGTETVIATISNASVGIISTDNATANIADDDTATVTIADVSGAEDGGAITLTATVDKAVDGGFTVEVNTADGTATLADSDYTQIAGQVLTFAGNAGETQTFTFTPTTDAALEEDETVAISMANASNPSVDVTDTATVTIANDDTATVAIAATDAHAQEGQGDDGVFTVTMSGAATTDVVVQYAVSGTATQSAEYTALPGSITIPAGDTTATIAVNAGAYDDPNVEGDETVIVTITGTDNTAVIAADAPDDTATVTIADDETDSSAGGNTLAAHISATDATADEGTEDPGQFTITLDNPVTQDTTITYAVSGGATAGSDYDALSGTVTIPGGATTATIDVVTASHDDATVEGDEFVTLTLTQTDNSGVAIAAAPDDVATVTIADDETDAAAGGTAISAQVAATDAAAAENPADGGVFTITLDKPATEDTTISYTITGTAAAGFDYADTLSGTVTIPGGSTSVDVPVDTSGYNDALVEGDETVIITLDAASNSGVSVDATQSVITIADDESLTVTLSATDAAAAEPSGDDGQFTVTMDGTVTTDVTVNYAIAGTATNAADYAQLNGSVTIPVGSTTATIAVAVTDDVMIEGDETVQLTLTGTDNSSVKLGATTTDTVTITDDDAATVSIAATDATAAENPADGGVFTISMDGVAMADTIVTYAVSGTATADSDYSALSGTATIPGGSNSVTVPVDVSGKDDALFEGDEDVVVTLTGVNANGNITVAASPDDTATVTIADDEANTVSADISATTNGDENGTTAMVFTVTLNMANNTGAPITFDTTASGGTATIASGSVANDYADVFGAGTITIADGATTGTLSVPVEDDMIAEGSETVDVTISNPSHSAVSIGTATATATIADNDSAGITVGAISGDTTEAGDTATFTIVLTSEPTADVTIGLSSDDTTEGTVAPQSVTFTPANWQAPQTVTVTGVDDTDVDGTVAYTIVTAPATSADAMYDGMDASDVAVNNLNDDTVSGNILIQIGNEADDPDTVPSTVTAEQLRQIEPTVTGIDDNNEQAYRDYIDTHPGEFSSPATQEEVQNMVNKVNAAQTLLQNIGIDADNGNNTNTPTMTADDLNNITGVSGAIAANEQAYRDYIVTHPDAFSSPATPAEVQAMIDAVNTSQGILAQIGNEADDPDTVPSTVTAEQLRQIEPTVTGVDDNNEQAYRDYIDTHPGEFSSPATQEEVQNMIGAVNAEQAGLKEVVEDIAGNSNGAIVTAQQLNAITGVSGAKAGTDYSKALEAAQHTSPSGYEDPSNPTPAEIQKVIDAVNAGPDTDDDGVPNGMDSDDDDDGISDIDENTGPNNGDGDGDGVPDAVQQNVSAAMNPATGAYATLKSAGADCTFITVHRFVTEESLPTQDSSATYPVGLADFQLRCSAAGQAADVVIYYDKQYDTSEWVWRKYNTTAQTYATVSGVTFGTATVGGKTVTTARFTVTDGDSATDEDGVADSVINDPSGPAIITGDPIILKKPSGIDISCSANGKARLTWEKIKGDAEGVKIHRKQDGGAWQMVKTIKGHRKHKYTDHGLISGTTYYYRIRAYADNERGKFSKKVSCTVPQKNTSWVSRVFTSIAGRDDYRLASTGDGIENREDRSGVSQSEVKTGTNALKEVRGIVSREHTIPQPPHAQKQRVTAECKSFHWLLWVVILLLLCVGIILVNTLTATMVSMLIGTLSWWFFDQCHTHWWMPVILVAVVIIYMLTRFWWRSSDK